MDAQAKVTGPPIGAPRRRLDVRPVLARGEEPFAVIIEATDGLLPGEVLALETPFKPEPLHKVMDRKGYAHHCVEVAPDHFITEYWVPVPGREAPPATEVILDVRGLEPPQPMELTLAALEDLPGTARLIQVNDRVPAFLLPHLEECGFEYSIGSDERGTVVTIWRDDA